MTERQLKPETKAAIRGAVEQIASRHELSDETRAELTAHLEDKALAYLAGEEPICEADAVLLARHHLGNPKSLGLQLAKASPGPGWFPRLLLERLGLAATVLFLCDAFASFLRCYVFIPMFVVKPFRAAIENGMPFNSASGIYGEILTMILGYVSLPFLLKWVATRRRVRTPMLTAPMIVLALLLNVFAASRPGIFSVMAANWLYIPNAEIVEPSRTLSWAYDAAGLLGPVLIFGIWLRYSCRSGPTFFNLSLASVGWFLAMALNSFAHNFGMGVEKSIHYGPTFHLNPAGYPLLQMLNDVAGFAFRNSIQFVIVSLAIQAPIALLGYGWVVKQSLSGAQKVVPVSTAP
jgi:hypothetical protein